MRARGCVTAGHVFVSIPAMGDRSHFAAMRGTLGDVCVGIATSVSYKRHLCIPQTYQSVGYRGGVCRAHTRVREFTNMRKEEEV